MDEECRLDQLALLMGYAGVYSSFLKHAFRQGERHGVSSAEILVRAGQRRLVGGQEDQLIDVAVELAAEAHRASLPSPSRPGAAHWTCGSGAARCLSWVDVADFDQPPAAAGVGEDRGHGPAFLRQFVDLVWHRKGADLAFEP